MKLTTIRPTYGPFAIWIYSVIGCTGATLTFSYRVPLNKNSLISSLTTVTLQTLYYNGLAFGISKVGNIVEVTVDGNIETEINDTTGFTATVTLPYAPPRFEYRICPLSDNDDSLLNFQLNTNGLCSVRPKKALAATTLLRCSFMYVTRTI